MGESKNREIAENDEESAVVILAQIRERLEIPKEAKILDYIKDHYTLNEKLIIATRYNDNGNLSAPFVNPKVPLKDLDVCQARIRRMVDNFISMREHMAREEAKKTGIITPGDKPKGGNIVT